MAAARAQHAAMAATAVQSVAGRSHLSSSSIPVAARRTGQPGAPRPAIGSTSLSTAWQAIGPMQVSTAAYGLVTGRVTSVALDPNDPSGNTVYLGTTGGGVWKSTNAAGAASGVSFAPLTDTLQVFSANAGSSATVSLSIGAVSVEPGGTGVLLAGTGDPNDATDSYYGGGMLRSADNGQTWSLVSESFDGVAGNHSFVGEGFAGFAWSATTPGLVVAAVSSSAEGSNVNASLAGASARGLFYSTDAGVTWRMATISDGAQIVQQASDSFSATYQGNAVTAVTWNPVRQRFYAAVRFHGYYDSPDGITWTRLAAQPGAGLTTSACPTRSGTTGLLNCPIFRGAVTAQPASGDLFALTVDGGNNDVGLYRDLCVSTGGACSSNTVLWGQRLPSTALEDGSGVIPQGDYNLALSAVPAATSLSATDTLLFAGTGDLFRCQLSNGCSLRNTTNATTGCAASAKVAPSQHAIAFQTTGNTAAPLLFFGNDGGLWRSTDGVNQQSTSCSADDATHFDNLNAALGSLAEISGLSTHPTDGGIGLAALGALGSAASTTSSSNATFQTVWNQLGTGESGSVAIDQANPSNWVVQSGFGVSLYTCPLGTGCTAANFTGAPSVGTAQVNGDLELADAPLLLDPALNSNVIVGTCRVYRGPTSGGSNWSGANAISPPLAGPANPVCSPANGLIRSLGAGGLTVLTNAAQTSGSPVLYAGLAGTNTGGGNAFGGHFYRTTHANLANGGTQWTDVTSGTVTNDQAHSGRFNPFSFDVSSISIDPGDPSGLTVYATVQGFNSPSVYRSTDGASSWVSITANLPNAPANAVVVDPNNSGVVYVALDTGVYVATDVTTCTAANAQCWSIFGSALPNAPVTKLVASVAFAQAGSAGNGVLRAGTYGRGIWQIPLITAGSSAMPVATLSPNALSFGAQAVGLTSTSQAITVTNTGNAPLTLSRVSASASFIETDNCAGATLGTGGVCTVQVGFAPSATGAVTGTLQVYGNVLGGYNSASLSGSGTGTATVLVTPAALTFQDTAVRATSPALTIFVTNQGNLPATLQQPSITSDFHLTGNTCGSSLPVNATCTFTASFTPTGSGLRTGLLQLADNTGTHSVTLNGNAIAGDITASPTSIQFPSTPLGQVSVNRSITVLNSGNGSLQIGTITVSGDFGESDTCAARTLPAGAGCTITARFSPAASGVRTGTMVIASNAKSDPNSVTTIALTGGGQGAFDIVLTPTTLDFGTTFIAGASPVQNITISNTGAGTGHLGTATVSGDFALRANTCGTSLSTQTGCTISIAFLPTAAGRRTGTFAITDDAGTQTATLTGTGVSAATDTLSPSGLTFAATTVNTNSAAQSITLQNNGDVALTLVAAKITAGDFTAVNGCGPSLAPHTSCGIAVRFSPKSVGTLTGTLEIDDVQRAQIVALTGSSLAGPGVSISPSTLNFAATGVGNATAAQTLTLTNNGTVALTLNAITASGDFGLIAGGVGGCAAGATLPVGSACTLQIAFAPKSAGPRSGGLSVLSNTAPLFVLTSGTGVDFSFASNGPASISVVNGKSAVFPLLLTPAIPSALPVTFTCTGAPANSKCTVTSTYSDLSATSTVSVTILTGTTLASLRKDGRPPQRFQRYPPGGVLEAASSAMHLARGGWLAVLFPLGLWGCVRRRRLGIVALRLLSLLVVVALAAGGCGSGRHVPDTGTGTGGTGGGTTAITPAGSYGIVVAVTGAGLTKQVPLTLSVTAQ